MKFKIGCNYLDCDGVCRGGENMGRIFLRVVFFK